MNMFQETTIFLQIISQEKQNILTMTTPDKIKELEDIIIDFNEYLETVAAGFKIWKQVSKLLWKISELKSKNYLKELKM